MNSKTKLDFSKIYRYNLITLKDSEITILEGFSDHFELMKNYKTYRKYYKKRKIFPFDCYNLQKYITIHVVKNYRIRNQY